GRHGARRGGPRGARADTAGAVSRVGVAAADAGTRRGGQRRGSAAGVRKAPLPTPRRARRRAERRDAGAAPRAFALGAASCAQTRTSPRRARRSPWDVATELLADGLVDVHWALAPR